MAKTFQILHEAEAIIEGIATTDAHKRDGSERFDPKGAFLAPNTMVPLFLRHDKSRVVGEVRELWKAGRQLRFRAQVTDDAIFAQIKSGELCECSVGGSILDTERLKDGSTIARKWRLDEISLAGAGEALVPDAVIETAEKLHPVTEIELAEPQLPPPPLDMKAVRASQLGAISARLGELNRLAKKLNANKWEEVGAVRDAMQKQLAAVDAERAVLVARKIEVETGVPLPETGSTVARHMAPEEQAWNQADLVELPLPSYPYGARLRGDRALIEDSFERFLKYFHGISARTFRDHGLTPSATPSMAHVAEIHGTILADSAWISHRCAELEQRVADLESGVVVGVKYAGVWQRQQKYAAGVLTTHKGGMWHCNVDSTGVEPGDGNKLWTLCAKVDGVPLPQRETAGRRIADGELKRPRTIERTVVTKHDEHGRILEFEKEQVKE